MAVQQVQEEPKAYANGGYFGPTSKNPNPGAGNPNFFSEGYAPATFNSTEEYNLAKKMGLHHAAFYGQNLTAAEQAGAS